MKQSYARITPWRNGPTQAIHEVLRDLQCEIDLVPAAPFYP